MTTEFCPLCTQHLVSPWGGTNQGKYAGILIVGENPEYEDVMTGQAFALAQQRGRFSRGDVLKNEFQRVGLMWNYVRRTYLYGHAMKDAKQIQEEFTFHQERCLKEIYKSRFVFLMGAEVVRQFTSYSVGEAYGLRVKSPLIPDTIQVWVGLAPGNALSEKGVIGELRFSIERFAEAVNVGISG